MADKIDMILDKLDALEKSHHHSAQRTQRIERLLIGDKGFEQEGLIHTVKSHQKFVEKEKLRDAKQMGIAMGFGAASGGVVAWVKSLFS